MENRIKNLLEKLDITIQEKEKTLFDIKSDVPTIISILESGFEKLKTLVSEYEFKDKSEEIKFFKERKPLLFSKLIYYQRIYYITLNFPVSGYHAQINYIINELDKINNFYFKNADFIKYYRSGDASMDELFFLRGKRNLIFNLDSFYFERDPCFSTAFDFKVAKLLANDLLANYLNHELAALKSQKNSLESYSDFLSDAYWTAIKVALVELIYAIHSAKSINSGNISLNELVSIFGKMFNIDLSNFSQIYREIRKRKINRTKYLNLLIDSLLQRMDHAKD